MENLENKVIAFTGEKQIEIMDHSMPELGDNDVLVHIKATALCTQEQRFYTGVKKVNNYPSVGGHESAGEVIAVGAKVKKVKVGDRVACGGGITPANGKRPFAGEQAKTPDADGFYQILQGTLAKYVVKNEDYVIPFGDDVEYKDICLTEPTGCVLCSINKANIQFADTVLVMGCGIMGLLHIQLAKMRGAIVIASEIDEERKLKAKKCGADFVIDPREVDVPAKVKEITGGSGAEIVFNTTAIPANWDTAFKAVARAGKIICYSSQHPDEPIPVSMGMIHSTKIQIIGTVASSPYEQYIAATLLAKRMIKTEDIIDSFYPFEQAKDAFERSIVPGTYRVIITD